MKEWHSTYIAKAMVNRNYCKYQIFWRAEHRQKTTATKTKSIVLRFLLSLTVVLSARTLLSHVLWVYFNFLRLPIWWKFPFQLFEFILFMMNHNRLHFIALSHWMHMNQKKNEKKCAIPFFDLWWEITAIAEAIKRNT